MELLLVLMVFGMLVLVMLAAGVLLLPHGGGYVLIGVAVLLGLIGSLGWYGLLRRKE